MPRNSRPDDSQLPAEQRGTGDAGAGARADGRAPDTSATRSPTSRGPAAAAATTSTAGTSASTAASAPGPTRSCARRRRCGWPTRRTIDDYVRRIASGARAVAMREEPSPRQFAGEALMLGLRTADGVDETAFALTHGAPPAALFPEAAALGAEKRLDRARRRPPAPDRIGDPLLERNLPPALLTRASVTAGERNHTGFRDEARPPRSGALSPSRAPCAPPRFSRDPRQRAAPAGDRASPAPPAAPRGSPRRRRPCIPT